MDPLQPTQPQTPPPPESPAVLEYCRPKPPPPWDFRPPSFVVVPFSIGTGVGAAGVVVIGAEFLIATREIESIVLALLGIFAAGALVTAVLCSVTVFLRQIISKRLLSAAADRTCFWSGAAFGAVYVAIAWATLQLEASVGPFNASWLWMLPLAGPVAASFSLVRLAMWRD